MILILRCASVVQAVEDGVHVLSLSLGPSSAPVGSVTFIDSFALACLGATRAGVHCVHAAGNTGSGPSTITSWSPWLTSVGATTTDRIYPSYLFTGDGRNYSGQGLSRKCFAHPQNLQCFKTWVWGFHSCPVDDENMLCNCVSTNAGIRFLSFDSCK